MRNLTVAAPLIIISLAIAFPVWSCSCPQNVTEEQHYKEASFVFVGTVGMVSQNYWQGSECLKSIGLQFKKILKGKPLIVNADGIKLLTPGGGTACGCRFEVGRTYKVYAYPSPNGYQTDLCSGTHALDDRSDIPNSQPDLCPNNPDLKNYSGGHQ